MSTHRQPPFTAGAVVYVTAASRAAAGHRGILLDTARPLRATHGNAVRTRARAASLSLEPFVGSTRSARRDATTARVLCDDGIQRDVPYSCLRAGTEESTRGSDSGQCMASDANEDSDDYSEYDSELNEEGCDGTPAVRKRRYASFPRNRPMRARIRFRGVAPSTTLMGEIRIRELCVQNGEYCDACSRHVVAPLLVGAAVRQRPQRMLVRANPYAIRRRRPRKQPGPTRARLALL